MKKLKKKLHKGKVKKISSEKRDSRPSSAQIEVYSKRIVDMKKEISKVIVGQNEIIDGLILALLCDAHVLLEGVPGIAKTLAIKTLARVTGCQSSRIQFTVDLLPSDIVGLTTYTPNKGFETIKGPVFTNFLLADEVNRSPPKTQSALLEAMEEKQVTIGKKTYPLSPPFFVMATQNPIESSGVYDLPEAQVDRFLFKLIMGYPDRSEEEIIMESNATLKPFSEFNLKAILSPVEIMKMQKLVKTIYLSPAIKEYIVDIVRETRSENFKLSEYIEWGSSPRAAIALYISSKARAFMKGRNYVVPQDVKDIAHSVLRHRIMLTYKAKADKLTSDRVIDEILSKIKPR